ncbi:hypothetical protein ACH5RR_017743 [Cinchona calisaya]|uniref:Receptor-like serine/threonine-protein kinase n=1 Tax=Cinchona calisaya TaxID=153742 RepID=A0ABD2ZK66_9GENT
MDILWQSFDYPGDTWIPGGKIGLNRVTNTTIELVSWKNMDNPAQGLYSLKMDPASSAELLALSNTTHTYWRSGAWQDGSFPSMETSGQDIYKFSYVSTDNGKYLLFNSNKSILSRIVMSYSGVMEQLTWSPSRQDWVVHRSSPASNCEVYNVCGGFGVCDLSSSPHCSCLTGFEPQFRNDWIISDFTGGCVRRTPLDCVRDKGKFLRISHIRLPPYSESLAVQGAEICEHACSINCSCSAFAYSSSGDCALWFDNLLDLERQQNGSTDGDLYVKLHSSEVSQASEVPAVRVQKTHNKSLPVALGASIASAILIICSLFYYLWRRKHKQKGDEMNYQNLSFLDLNSNRPNDKSGTTSKGTRHVEEKNETGGLPMFSFSSIVAVTNNFSSANKLGKGGFGPVYKGQLLSGELVAVKRLSKGSGQGTEEFKNETDLIAKLQHRNLVRILGCCVEQDEKILIYEYMPNRSLDSFLFGPKQDILDLEQRVRIIEGIAQGLLYLHQYSRLRVVHRDLKASNILLDAYMDPKISDFGLARILGVNEMQANTNRIVGTYGYMSPEYVMEGLFSTKSDVFAFGILVLEIISGKKSTGYYGSENLTLLGHAWELWKSDKVLELIDPLLQISSSSNLVRCIGIGLLCVQENPADRPTMSNVVVMLSNEQISLVSPNQPAFTTWRNFLDASSNGSGFAVCSANDVTISLMEAR